MRRPAWKLLISTVLSQRGHLLPQQSLWQCTHGARFCSTSHPAGIGLLGHPGLRTPGDWALVCDEAKKR